MMELEQAFKEAKKLAKNRTDNQEKALAEFYERKRLNEIQKNKNADK